MDKIKLSFRSPKTKIVEYGEQRIEVRPFISITEQRVLIQTYIDTYFNFSKENIPTLSNYEHNYIDAEYNLIHSIFHLLTNVDIDSIDTDMYDGTDLWKDVRSKIKNYDEFYERLQRIVSDIKEELLEKNSVSKLIKELSDKAFLVLDEFAKISPAEAEKMKISGLEMLEKIENSPASKIIDEAKPIRSKKAK